MEYKKGLLQQVMNRDLRFRDDEGNEYPEWEEKKLGDVAEIIAGGTPDTAMPEYWNGDINWFTPSEIGREKYVSVSARKISSEGLKRSSAKMLKPGTILLTSRATIGEMAILKNPASTNQGFQSLTAKDGVSNEFLYYNQSKIKKDCLRKASGSTFLEINKNEISKILLMIPTIEEQQKIATLFSFLDQKIEKEKEKLELIKEMKKGYMQKMFV